MAEEKKRMYNLILKTNDKEIVLLKDTLKNIDSFTTAFKNEGELIENSIDKQKIENINGDVYIKSSRGTEYYFIGSSICNVTDDFENEDYINTLCKLATTDELSSFVKDYFIGNLENRVADSTNNKKEFDSKMNSYMLNNDIPEVKIINLYKKIDELKKYQNSRENNKMISDLYVEIVYNLRRYNSSYNDYRNLYAYIVSNGFFPQRKHQYDEDMISKNLKLISSKIEDELVFVQQSFIPTDNNELVTESDDDIEIELDFIEHDDTSFNQNDDPTYYPQTIINNPNMTDEEKIEEINNYVDDPNERNYYVKKVNQG